MSGKKAEDFLEKMMNDEAFKDSVINIVNVKERIEFIHRQGFSFTSDELQNAWFLMQIEKPISDTSGYVSK